MPRGRKKKIETTEDVETTTTSTDAVVDMRTSTEVEVPAVEPVATESAPEETVAPTPEPEVVMEPEIILPELEVTERPLPYGGVTLEVCAPDNCVYELSNLPAKYKAQLPKQYQ